MATLQEHRAAWLRQARWGVFCHYLADAASSAAPVALDAAEWNRRVDAFDVARFARQLASVGAPYVVLTIGQNSGYYCAPNAAYARWVDDGPSRLSRRDLVADLAVALRSRGIRLLVYLPCHAPVHHRAAVEGLGCTPRWDATCFGLRPGSYLAAPDVDERLTVFQRRWEGIVREWSERWGEDVSGWWIDGCYRADRMYHASGEPNFASFAAALRAGNPQSILAFNPGVRVPVVPGPEEEDFTAGEVSDAFPWDPPAGCRDGLLGSSQYHLLTYLGQYWGRGEPRFAPVLVAAATHHLNALGGVLTWDVPVSWDGVIPEPFLRCLAAISPAEALDAPRPAPPEVPSDALDGALDGPVEGRSQAHPAAGTRTVEPRFVRLVRAAAGQTQAQFADALRVHVRTVVAWECSEQPVRVRTSAYLRLTELAAQRGLL